MLEEYPTSSSARMSASVQALQKMKEGAVLRHGGQTRSTKGLLVIFFP